MCGISVIINKNGLSVPEADIRSMTNMVIHRGPDDEGYYFGKGFAFGHRRLSIIDLTQGGHQPMIRDNYTLIYNGEIYNYLELIDELKELGHIFKTHSDTEIIFPAYWEWGIDAFHKFNGMWAFALYDATNNVIMICRDRFGVKPIYYTSIGDSFFVASEIKQFTCIEGFKPVLNKKVAVNFLSTGLLNYSNETFFEGVYELPPGHFMKYDLSTHEITMERWYDLTAATEPIHDHEKDPVKIVNELLSDSVRIRMRSDVQVGSCLSGGLDSSSIVSVIHDRKLADPNFTTITSCYDDKEYDEQEFSDKVTVQTGFPYLKVYPNLDDLMSKDYLNTMIWYHDQPFATGSHYSEFSVFKAARENNIVVLLDGQGSDEYFCGYEEFFLVYIMQLLRKGKWLTAWKNLRHKASIQNIGITSQVKNFFRTAFWFPLIQFSKKLIGRTDFPWLIPAYSKIADAEQPSFVSTTIKELSVQQVLHTSLPYQLHSADRNSMIFSLEVREPFIDYRLVEYVLGLPDEFKIRNGYSKYILREAIDELPEQIRNRSHKMGFVAPDKKWVLENKEMIRNELEDAIKNTGFFTQALVERFDLFVSGKLGYEMCYLRAITFNRFCKIFNMDLS